MNSNSETIFFEDLKALPNPGLGLGLRHVHFTHILEQNPEVDWFEIISENFMYSHGKPRYILNQIGERYPIVMHGVSLSVGSTEVLNMDYLQKLKTLAEEIKPLWISDHLCWTGVLGKNSHDLLPLPLTEATLKHVSERIDFVQNYLRRPLIIENPSTYLSFSQSTIPEQDFLTELVKRSGCGLLLDVNNCYVSCYNSGADPQAYINALPHEAIVQMHLAGHQHCGTHIIDTHDRAVVKEVWDLFHQAWKLTGGCATLLEWDGNIPAFEVCLEELHKAKIYMHQPASVLFPEQAEDLTIEELSTPIDFMINPLMEETLHNLGSDVSQAH